jgi:hypothetical protein
MIAEFERVLSQVEFKKPVIFPPEKERWRRDPRWGVRGSVLSQGTIVVQHSRQGTGAGPSRLVPIEFAGLECIGPRPGLDKLAQHCEVEPFKNGLGQPGQLEHSDIAAP